MRALFRAAGFAECRGRKRIFRAHRIGGHICAIGFSVYAPSMPPTRADFDIIAQHSRVETSCWTLDYPLTRHRQVSALPLNVPPHQPTLVAETHDVTGLRVQVGSWVAMWDSRAFHAASTFSFFPGSDRVGFRAASVYSSARRRHSSHDSSRSCLPFAPQMCPTFLQTPSQAFGNRHMWTLDRHRPWGAGFRTMLSKARLLPQSDRGGIIFGLSRLRPVAARSLRGLLRLPVL